MLRSRSWLVLSLISAACGGDSQADLTERAPCEGDHCDDDDAAPDAGDGGNADDDGDDDAQVDDAVPDDDLPPITVDDDVGADDDDDDSPTDDDGASDDDTPTDDDVPVLDDDVPGDDDLPPPNPDCTFWDGSTVHAQFDVPGAADATAGDYFRLPFPNDILRFEDGTVNLTGFPAATALAQGFIDAVSGTLTGFSNYPTVTLRFSGIVDFSSIDGRVFLVDITDPRDPIQSGVIYNYSAGGGVYVCHDSLSIRVPNGRPLEPGHTYAAGVRNGLIDDNGARVEATDHFRTLLDPATPSDPVLATAHAAYAPFREYIESGGESAADYLTAAVFTTEDPRRDMQALAQLVSDEPGPSVTSWARCGTDPSPCPDTSDDRACTAPSDLYDEYHALVGLPIFQQGDAPYLQAGGAIDFSGVVREEQVCIALSVPKASPPENGFPLVLIGHGAGGSYRSGMTSSVAERLAAFGEEAVPLRSVAVLGFDQVAHGPRRGSGAGAAFDPELLLFNILNPASARGTTLQAGADVVTMARFAKTLSIPAAATGADDIVFDTTHLAYWGHSQGGSQGAIALPFTDDVVATVLSGTGAGILHALLERTNPAEIPIAVRDSIGDPGSNGEPVRGDIRHPMLGVVQHWVDAVDPLHFARHLVLAPPEGRRPKHVFAPYGIGDTYSPPTNLRNFLVAAGLQGTQPHPSADPADALGPELGLPLSGNGAWMEEVFTAGFRQYGAPQGDDGHFVAFRAEAANDDVIRFLVQAVHGELPEIGAP